MKVLPYLNRPVEENQHPGKCGDKAARTCSLLMLEQGA